LIDQYLRLTRRAGLKLIVASLAAAAAPSVLAAPPIVRIVHSFNGLDGKYPGTEGLVRGPLGTVFGVTRGGGLRDEGALFFVDAFDFFHSVRSFSAGGRRGWMPESVFFSSTGQLYGTTGAGGAYDCGTAYRINLIGVFTTIHHFDCVDGSYPNGPVVAQDGFFYGTTARGGNTAGNYYRLSSAGEVTVLRDVPQNYSNEAGLTGLARGPGGEFYGTSEGWALGGRGNVFKIDTAGNYTVLHTFEGGADGLWAASPPTVTADGTVYGTTSRGGEYDAGTIYRITPEGEYSVMRTLDGETLTPYAGLVLSQNGNLYGTTVNGGIDGYGTVFELKPSGEFEVIYKFSGLNYFSYPQGGLVETTRGTFYGTTGAGGHFNLGTIYKLTLQ
jgi:uncharacterized repeat protein (TIGR03803 family)